MESELSIWQKFIRDLVVMGIEPPSVIKISRRQMQGMWKELMKENWDKQPFKHNGSVLIEGVPFVWGKRERVK